MSNKPAHYLKEQFDAIQYYDGLNLPEYLNKIPHTACGISDTGRLSYPSVKALQYIMKASPLWREQLILAAFVLAAADFRNKSIMAYLRVVNQLFSKFLKKYEIDKAEICGRLDLTSSLINTAFENMFDSGRISDNMKQEWLTKYKSVSARVSAWYFANIKYFGFNIEYYKCLLFPEVTSPSVLVLVKRYRKISALKSRNKKKDESDVIFSNFRGIAIQARHRLNIFERFYAAALQAEKQAIKNKSLSLNYSYEEQGSVVTCRLVHMLMIVGRIEPYLDDLGYRPLNAALAELKSSEIKYESQYYFVEFLESEKKEMFWFLELAENGILNPNVLLMDSVRKAFLKRYGYTSGQMANAYLTRGRYESVPKGLVDLTAHLTKTIFISAHELRLQFHFAALFIEFVVTTGARINEVLQLSASEECLKVVNVKTSNGQDIEKYIVMLIPKGAEEPAPYFIGEETFNLLFRTYEVLSTHYKIFDDSDEIPHIDPNSLNHKSDFLHKKPFVFQVNKRHLDALNVMTAVRYLVHGMSFTVVGENGRLQNVSLKAHLLRHAFATYAVHSQKIPVDVVAKMLNQKNLEVTKYYSQPTLSVISEHHKSITNALFDNIDLDNLAARSSKEFQVMYQEALDKSGTLTEVLGGTCVSHGYCPAKTSCIGCGAKIPDPKKRDVIERRLDWALKEIEWNREHGFSAEVRKCAVIIQSCKSELYEMVEIEKYQAEDREIVKIFDSEAQPLKWVGDSENE